MWQPRVVAVSSIGLATVLVVGCGTVIYTHPLNPMPHEMPARDPATVEIFTTGAPKRPYVETSLIEARQGGDEGAVFTDLRARAGALGCDGLVLLGSTDSVEGLTLGLGTSDNNQISGYTDTLHGYRATCIAWTTKATEPDVRPVTPDAGATVDGPIAH